MKSMPQSMPQADNPMTQDQMLDNADNILELRNISKGFPGVRALDDVDLTLKKGEVHVILGENGAGKSTLMKVLSGAYTPDKGEIILDGQHIAKNSPIISEGLGIRMIYQELNLVPELSIQANLFLGHEKRNGPFLDKKAMERDAKALLAEMGINEKPSTLVRDLSIATRQMIEIARALSGSVKVLVFDEPTSSLTNAEIERLFEMIGQLKARGVGMFYISHRLEEVFMIGDRVSIMRDGVRVHTADVSDIDMDRVITEIAGRKIENLYPHIPQAPGKCLFEVKDLCSERFEHINLKVHAGEIVGLSGLVGAGRSEVARAAFGVDDYTQGEVFVDGQRLPKKNPGAAVKSGLCLLPENRKEEGLALSLGIEENVTIAALHQMFPSGIVGSSASKVAVREYVDKLSIATPSIAKLVNYLSGGTQQKVVVAKWLLTKSKVFIFDEPTRGIDVGAKTDIYQLMDMLAKQGAAIVMISSDLAEVIGMSDRICVLCRGRLVGEFEAGQADQNTILQYAFGQTKEESGA